MSRFPNRRWLVIPTMETGSLDFNEVLESGPEQLRISTDGNYTFVKYEVNEITASYTESFYNPETEQTESVTFEQGTYGRPSIYADYYNEYNHSEILDLLATDAWKGQQEESDIE